MTSMSEAKKVAIGVVRARKKLSVTNEGGEGMIRE